MQLVCASCKTDTSPLEAGSVLDAGFEEDAEVADVPEAGDVPALPDVQMQRPDIGVEVPDSGLAGGIGEACVERTDCQSADSPSADLWPTPCITNGGNPWPGGYCTDYCQLPDDAFVLPLLVRADCPEGAVCLPRTESSTGQAPEEIGGCFEECTADDDCRVDEGYYCRRTFWRQDGEITFDNGYCAPDHCTSRGCPFSFVCGC